MRQSIKIALNPDAQMGKKKRKTETVEADVVGGIAVHKYEGSWRLTHVESGRRIGGSSFSLTKSAATKERKLLLAAADWTLDGDEILSQLQVAALRIRSGRSCVEAVLFGAATP